jgi:amidase
VVAYGLPPKVRAKLQAQAAGFAPGDLSHRALQARGAALTPAGYQQVQNGRLALKRKWRRFFTRFDVVLTAPAPVTAIAPDLSPDLHARRLDLDGEARPWLDFLVWGALASVADLPALSAPVMTGADGLPAGVQIIAAEHEDLPAIAVGRMLEEHGAGYLPPPGNAA